MPSHTAASSRASSFFDGVDTSLNSIASLSSAPPAALVRGLQHLTAQLNAATSALNPANPAALAPALVQAQHDLGALLDTLEHTAFPGRADILHELRIKQVQLNDALGCALGLQLTATAPSANVLPGTDVQVQTTLLSHAGEPIGLFAESLETPAGARAEHLLSIDTEPRLQQAQPFNLQLTSGATLTRTVTRPYFERKSVEEPVYQVSDPALRNAPATPAPLTAWVTLRYHQTEIRIGRVVENNNQALNIIPPASVLPVGHAQVLTTAQTSLPVDLNVRPSDLRVEAGLPPGWHVTPDVPTRGTPDSFKRLALRPPATGRHPFSLHLVGVPAGTPEITEGFRPVGYPGLPRTNYFTPATDRIVPVDLGLPTHRHIAYLAGTGDAVADSLRSIGFEVTDLQVADLTPGNLARFDTVILGVRTYNAHPDLHGAPTQALLDYARGGGNVILQYQTGEFTAADAPYPLTLGNAEKVVDETAPVRLLTPANLDPAHLTPAQAPWRPLLTPNHITPADFNGWIEERGHGFLESWDPHYTALTETHDPGAPAEHIAPQVPQEGGLITTPLGRGHWTYAAYALYRQLPEAVPGAFRLLTNLLALADSPTP